MKVAFRTNRDIAPRAIQRMERQFNDLPRGPTTSKA